MLYWNQTTLAGRAVADAEYRPVGSTAVASFRIVSNKRVKKRNGEYEEKSTFVDCEAWGPRADFARKYVRRGAQLIVRGELEQDEWVSKNNERRSKLKIYVQDTRTLERVEAKEDSDEATEDGQPVHASSNDFADELPF